MFEHYKEFKIQGVCATLVRQFLAEGIHQVTVEVYFWVTSKYFNFTSY